MNSSKKQKNLNLVYLTLLFNPQVFSIKKYLDESKSHTVLLFLKDIIKKGLSSGIKNYKVIILPDVHIPINDPAKFVKNSDNKLLIFEKLNEVKGGGCNRDLSIITKIIEYEPSQENFLLLVADDKVTIPYGQSLPTPDRGFFTSVFATRVKNQENHYYHKLHEYGFNNLFLINEFKDLDTAFEPLKKGSFLSSLFNSEKKIEMNVTELTYTGIEDEDNRDISRTTEQTIEYTSFTSKIFAYDPKLLESYLRKSNSSTSLRSSNSNSEKKAESSPDLDMMSPSKLDENQSNFGYESPLITSEAKSLITPQPIQEEFKYDNSLKNSDVKKQADSDNKQDLSFSRKSQSTPSTITINENIAVSPPSTKKMVQPFTTDQKVETLSQDDSSDDIMCIWDAKLDFVKPNLKGLPSHTEHISLSDLRMEAQYSHSFFILYINQYGALGREKEELCTNLLAKFDKKMKIVYVSLDTKIPSLDLFYSDKKKVESVKAQYAKIKDKFSIETKEVNKINTFLTNLLSSKK